MFARHICIFFVQPPRCSLYPAKSFWEGTSHTLFYGCILLEIPSTVYLQVNKNALLFSSLLIKHCCTKQPRGTQTPPFHFFFFFINIFWFVSVCACVWVDAAGRDGAVPRSVREPGEPARRGPAGVGETSVQLQRCGTNAGHQRASSPPQSQRPWGAGTHSAAAFAKPQSSSASKCNVT